VIHFTIQWNNAWNNSRNHDAAWIFFNGQRSVYGSSIALYVAESGHTIIKNHIGDSNASIKTVQDRTGLFILTGAGYRGNINVTISAALDSASLVRASQAQMIGAYGVEMVYIPEGKYFIGDTSRMAVNDYNGFYRSDAAGNPAGFYEVAGENNPIPIGPVDGSIYYKVNEKIYQGDRQGPVPASFPKGYRAFYIMKYELKQGQYTAFLNKLDSEASAERAPFGGKEYYKKRGSIYLKDSLYDASFPDRPFNWSSWDDGMAYADWARLRPMTELEFIKAARGSEMPVARGFVWGTASKDRLARIIDKNGDLIYKGNENEKDLNDNNRDVFGASYYWVMDLNGSVWERCVTIGDSLGRAFQGTHGDGRLSIGYATNRDWPKGSNEYGGFGFRGGGYYTERNNDNHVPHSPIEFRRYGSWAGGFREVAYGQRFVRTAEW
jgi:formylglycine-generating enzyme required for sulfatase activity